MDGVEISRKAFGWIGGDIGIAAAKAWPVRRKSMASLRKAMSEASDDDNGDKLWMSPRRELRRGGLRIQRNEMKRDGNRKNIKRIKRREARITW
jgi:hypothetical protein